MSIDVHQHLWTPAFVAALRARTRPPFLDGWTLHLDGEPPYAIDPDDHDVTLRAKRNAGLQLALISLSSPLGIEHLPAAEAWPLLDAYHAGARELPAPFAAWAAASVTDVDPVRLSHTLSEGFHGLQLPATALLDEAGLATMAPLLDVLERESRPLFIHPGPAAQTQRPSWWAAVVPYVQQMHAAWHAFRAFGRPRHPRLRVCFALLAGLAPLHSERLLSRSESTHKGQVDPNAFLETSSYGPRATDAVIRELGVDVVVNGSDQPYAEAAELPFGDAAHHAVQVTNPARLLYGKEHA
ncbi:amidohydrolase [Streptosporangiaceae bacterium NEAU-GS5]|nr:amidohydrolase [Streptosporangiaceae bacterium NEAU-GS5]